MLVERSPVLVSAQEKLFTQDIFGLLSSFNSNNSCCTAVKHTLWEQKLLRLWVLGFFLLLSFPIRYK